MAIICLGLSDNGKLSYKESENIFFTLGEESFQGDDILRGKVKKNKIVKNTYVYVSSEKGIIFENMCPRIFRERK